MGQVRCWEWGSFCGLDLGGRPGETLEVELWGLADGLEEGCEGKRERTQGDFLGLMEQMGGPRHCLLGWGS